ncbi:hypothetical protein NVP1112O_07 [Vibrio phage 1.112.O._10N.286.46.B11]|nr:hypothetical protein NVP1112O_07 [Vibrio phage 1.112.O._10N.286.46.B11]
MFIYTVVLEDWSFGELNDAAKYAEFDNPEEAFALHDEIDGVMESNGTGDHLFEGKLYDSVDVKVSRKK